MACVIMCCIDLSRFQPVTQSIVQAGKLASELVGRCLGEPQDAGLEDIHSVNFAIDAPVFMVDHLPLVFALRYAATLEDADREWAIETGDARLAEQARGQCPIATILVGQVVAV